MTKSLRDIGFEHCYQAEEVGWVLYLEGSTDLAILRACLPREGGPVTVRQVIAASPGIQRDQAIDAWCASVWGAFREHERAVAELLKQYGIA